MSNFWKAFLATAIPISALEIISVIGFSGFFLLNLMVFYVLALVAAIVLAIRRKRRVAAGIFAGLAVSILVLATTCFASTLFTNLG